MGSPTDQDKIARCTNAIDAYFFTAEACKAHFNVLNFGLRKIKARKEGRLDQELIDQQNLIKVYRANYSEWCKNYFAKNFPHFLNCRLGKVAMGLEKPDRTGFGAYLVGF